MTLTPAIIAAIISGGFELLRQYLGKPAGWVPTQQDIDDLHSSVDAATPEAVKAAARIRLGLPPV